jgi:hypothetical protein
MTTESIWTEYKKDDGATWPPQTTFYLVWVNNLWGGNKRIHIGSFDRANNSWTARDDVPFPSFGDAVTHWCELPPDPNSK